MKAFDVVVVGGGPIGATAARVAAEEGVSVLLVERRTELSIPAACTGLVSPRTLSVLGAPDSVVIRSIRAVVIHAPGGAELTVRASDEKALVVDRSRLESELLEAAAQVGVEVRLGATAVGRSEGGLLLQSANGSVVVTGRVVIGADGPRSQVAEWYGLSTGGRVAQAIQAELACPAAEGDRVDVFVGRHVAPGYFAWTVPAENGCLRVGLTVDEGVDPGPFLERLVTDRFPEARRLSTVEAWIPIPPGGSAVGDGVLLVGDAAAQIKPLSGGGLYFGGLCARAAGRIAARAARSGAVSSESLRTYDEACRASIGSETRFGAALRSILQGLPDDRIDAVVDKLQDGELCAMAAERGDLDHLGQILVYAASHPRLWKRLLALWSTVRVAGDADLPSDPLAVV